VHRTRAAWSRIVKSVSIPIRGGGAQEHSAAGADVILIGEIRARETMEYCIQFAETGHLVLATLHANSSNQALDRIINFFPRSAASSSSWISRSISAA